MKVEDPSIDAESEFFSIGAESPHLDILKKYGRYLVRSRNGKIADNISLASINTYMSQLFAIIRRESQPNDSGSGNFRAVRKELNLYVNNNLAQQENISTAIRSKAVAHSEDLTFLLQRLYESDYLDTFHDMRLVLNLTLCMCLLVDTCERASGN
ncbi:hypothetical protein F4680DRAFT_436693 [Xylaria scruposa]|nr:hypothetical protein F4680DRAFT_436693 [Xylaria scruposa]